MARRRDPERGAATGGLADAVVFLVFVAVGAAYVIWSKLTGLPPAAVTMVPVSIMLVYAAVVVFVRALRLREDQSGDNLYYMGFLFTLTSLAVSLWQFDAGGPPEDIVRNFGIAIGSTIAGIALRIFMNQLRRDPQDVERGARYELADAARRVRRELDATVVELNQFRRATQQIAEESWSDVRGQIETTSARILAAVEGVTERSTAPIEAAGRASGESLGAMSRTVLASLKETADALAGESAALARRAEASVEAASERMTASLEAAAARLSRESQHLSGQTAALSASIEALSRSLRDLAVPEGAAAAPAAVEIAAAVREIGAALERHGQRLDALVAALPPVAEAAVPAAEEIAPAGEPEPAAARTGEGT